MFAAPPPPPPNSSIKHRACDECRTRKLACSKDPDGCNRCKGERISCHYSEQKPMGRPRKRQFIETQPYDASNGRTFRNDLEFPIPDDVYSGSVLAEPYFTNFQDFEPFPSQDDGIAKHPKPKAKVTIWNFGDGQLSTAPTFDFRTNDTGTSDAVFSKTSSASSSSIADEKASTQPPPCSCLAAMYLAMASLQQLPQGVVPVLRLIRSAASTAAKAIWCPQCGSVHVESPGMPIDAFQNTMLLGTMLPIIANGYAKLLKMIDEEADVASTSGQTKTFRYLDFGGHCPAQNTVEEAMLCAEKEIRFEAVEMPPFQWRDTVRALLRVDIYGHQDTNVHRKGLRDLVSELELRQETRHLLDFEPVANLGNLNAASISSSTQLGDNVCPISGERTHACLEILKMAKFAVDSLVVT